MRILILFLCLMGSFFSVQAQLDSTGGTHVGFTVDADTKTGHSKLGPPSAAVFNNDDWFSPLPYPGTGKSVIDTTNSAFFKSRLQANNNFTFTKRMSQPVFAIVDGRFWVDAIYTHDFTATDSTVYTVASKNGDNPNTWEGGTSSIQSKSDIMDTYLHVRTSGLNPFADSVWFFAGVATRGVNGARYFDIEVYKETFQYNRTLGRFVTAGLDNGHSAWRFGPAGNVIQTGDIIISVTYDNRSAPQIDFRIWVSDSTYNNVTPTAFRFNSAYDGSNGFGYAQIISPSGSTQWGSGLGNFSSSSSTDTTFSTPWGSVNTSDAWSPNYDRLQFLEVALNFSRFGMNPFQYVTSFCKSPYSSVIVKSRASPSFSANLMDFILPQPFTVKNVAPFTLTPDTLSCNQPAATIVINPTARNYYRWKNLSGTTLRADSDSINYTVFSPGTYVVESTNFQGCPAMQRDTIRVPADTSRPVATAMIGHSRPYYWLIGGNAEASNFSTPFGGSSGITFQWTGPHSFSSTDQNPILDPFYPGTYQLTVTEPRNGCQATALVYMDSSVLAMQDLFLTAQQKQEGIRLSWNTPDETQSWNFEVQWSQDGIHYSTTTSLYGHAWPSQPFTYLEASGKQGWYRVKAISKHDGSWVYSNRVRMQDGKRSDVTMARVYGTDRIRVTMNLTGQVSFQLMDLQGRILSLKNTRADKDPTDTTVTIPAAMIHQPLILAVFVDGQPVIAKKL